MHIAALGAAAGACIDPQCFVASASTAGYHTSVCTSSCEGADEAVVHSQVAVISESASGLWNRRSSSGVPKVKSRRMFSKYVAPKMSVNSVSSSAVSEPPRSCAVRSHLWLLGVPGWPFLTLIYSGLITDKFDCTYPCTTVRGASAGAVAGSRCHEVTTAAGSRRCAADDAANFVLVLSVEGAAQGSGILVEYWASRSWSLFSSTQRLWLDAALTAKERTARRIMGDDCAGTVRRFDFTLLLRRCQQAAWRLVSLQVGALGACRAAHTRW